MTITRKGNSQYNRRIKIVVILITGEQITGTYWIPKEMRFSDALNSHDKEFITLANVKYKGKILPLFMVYKMNILGVLPTNIEDV